MSANNWTLERDQDQAGPYIFRKNEWIAFDDAVSIDIKAKYSRVRGLAGLALKDMTQDGGDKCSGSLLEAAFNGLSKQARAPRGAVLHSLEREILERPARQLENIHLSPYRISRVIDVEGKVHVIRQDTRTEFECSRQGYFVHPRSCGRFYRCVKFDQLTDEYSVFEFDCPAGLAFDSRVEVCVWPGSLPHASACAGSSEIAPVPKERFVCPGEQGYYADPENCRWFFACLDHGKSHMTAYEFRCPFGLVFDQDRLLCEWPWLVPKCASGAASSIVLGLYQPSVTVHGGHGIAGADFILERYDGLGNLGRVTLGGVAGHIEQPVAKVYSSFGAHGAGIAGHGATLLGGSQTGHLGYVGGNGGIASGGANLGVGSGGSVIYHGNTNLASGINEGLTLNAGHVLRYNGENSGIASGGGVNLEDGGGASVIYHGNTNLASGINEGLTVLDGSQNRHSSYSGENTGIASGGGVNLENGGGASVIYHGNTNLASGINEGLTVLDGSKNRHSSYSGENTGIASGGAYLGASDGASATYHGKTNLVAGINDGLTGAFRGNVKYLSGGGQIDGNQQTGSYSYQNNGNEILKSSLHQGVNGYDASLGNIGTVVALESSGIGDGKYLKTSAASRGSTKYHGLATDSLQGGLNGGIASYSVGLENSKGNGGLIGVYDVGGEVSQSNDLSAVNHGGNNLQSTVTYHGNNLNYAGDANVNVQDSGLAVLTDGYNADKLDNINRQQIITTGINGRLVDGDGSFTTGQHGITGSNRYQEQSGQALDFSNGVISTAPHGPADFSNVVVHGKQQVDLSRQNAAALNTGYVLTGTAVAGNEEDYRGSDHVITGFSSQNAGINQGGVKTGIQVIGGQNQGVQFYGNANGQGGHGVELLQNADVQIGSQNRGIAGNIDIIGGGFSAVKSGSESRSGVQLIQHGASVDAIEHVTAVPVSVTPSSISTANIPVVTSVPVPAIKTATGFDVYKGGVVANVPELQYKLDSPKSISNAFYQTQIKGSSYSAAGSSSFANPSSSLVGYASSTAAPILAATGGYALSKPFVDDLKIVSPAVSAVQQAQTAGYDYSKSTDSVSFINQQVEPIVHQQVSLVQQPTGSTILATHQTPATVLEERYHQPVVVSQPVQPAVATSYNYHQANHQSQGYVYNQPATVQKPAVISSFSISQPSSINVIPTQAVPVEHVVPVQVVQQPQVVSSYDYEGTDQKSRGGYIYKKPSVVFEEVPAQKPAVVSTFSISQSTTPAPLETVVPVHPVQQPSYSYQKSQRYVYERPNVVFEEQPHQKPAVVSSFSFSQPAVGVLPVQPAPISLQGYQHSVQHSNDYLSNRSTVYFEQRPQAAVVSGGYNYVSPLDDQQPILQAEIQKATAQRVQPIQIGSAYGYQNSAHSLDYDYSKSTVAVDKNPVTVAPFATTYTLQQPAEFQKNVVVNSINHYQRPPSIQKTVDAGYVYPKPSVQFVEEPSPVITNYENFEPVREEPFVAKKAYVTGYQNTKPNVVESYSVSSTPAYQQTIYSTPKPPVTFASTYRPILTDQYVLSTPRPHLPSTHAPVVIEDYYVSSTPRPTFASTIASVISAKTQPITENPLTFYSYDSSRLVSTPKTVFQATPVDVPVTQSRPVSRYSFGSLDQNYNVASTPVSLVENAAPIIHESINVLPQRRPINRYSLNQRYHLASTPISIVDSAIPVIPETVTVAPVVSSVHQSRPISRYSFSSLDQNYNVASTPVSLVENAAPIIHESINVLPQRRPINRYSTNQRYHLASTPISIVDSAVPVIPETATAVPQSRYFVSTPATLVEEHAAPVVAPVLPAVAVTQSKPISRYSFSSLDDKYNNYVANQAAFVDVSSTSAPSFTSFTEPVSHYPFGNSQSFIEHFSSAVIPKTLVTDTRRRNYAPTIPTNVYDDERVDVSTSVPIFSTTTSRPISRYSFSSLDDNYSFTPSTPTNVVVDDVLVSTPKTVVEVTPGYLPPVQQYVENYEVGKAIKSRRPVKVVKLVRPKSQAIVKVNDFHPLLAAKLGAQCTCVSNTLRLKKKPVRVQIYDDDDVEEYVVKQDNNLDVINNDYSNLLTDSDLQQRTKGVAIEDYQFEPEKVVEITPVPEIGVLPDIHEPILVRKRVRVRPPYLSTTTAAYDDEFPVSKVTDIFLKSTAAPSIQIIDDIDVGPDQKEVEDVVRKGLSLIKSAAKQGTKEALAEHTYDRYGPGGVRSRDETLQGTVDCQRAGLFRHPTHCNKFYACRWDCTKNRYTLHVFNCPVHLTFDNNLGACNWPSQGPACLGNTLLPSE